MMNIFSRVMIAVLPMTSLAIIQESSNQSSGLGLSIPKPRLKRKFAVISIFSVTPQTENKLQLL